MNAADRFPAMQLVVSSYQELLAAFPLAPDGLTESQTL